MIPDNALIPWFNHRLKCCAAAPWVLHGAAIAKNVPVNKLVSIHTAKLMAFGIQSLIGLAR